VTERPFLLLCLRQVHSAVAAGTAFLFICASAAALVYALAGCASSPVEPYAGQASRLETLYVIAGGWHTEIGLPAHAMTGSLVALKQASPGSQYFVFGWGQRHYYMAQNPGLGELLEALLPAPAVMLVIPLNRPPSEFFTADSSVFAIRVTQDGLDRLSQFLWGYLEKDPDHIPHRLGEGPYPGSSFYDSNGTYSLANTCNTWTAEALRASGLLVSAAGVVSAHQVVDQVQRLSEPQEDPTHRSTNPS
jgi:uncharacterized protein (TIGR02117 family)